MRRKKFSQLSQTTEVQNPAPFAGGMNVQHAGSFQPLSYTQSCTFPTTGSIALSCG